MSTVFWGSPYLRSGSGERHGLLYPNYSPSAERHSRDGRKRANSNLIAPALVQSQWTQTAGIAAAVGHDTGT
jgi:hypothetical protein